MIKAHVESISKMQLSNLSLFPFSRKNDSKESQFQQITSCKQRQLALFVLCERQKCVFKKCPHLEKMLNVNLKALSGRNHAEFKSIFSGAIC